MKRLLIAALIALGINAAPALAAESISDFHVDAKLDADRKLSITEYINYDFGDLDKHGIYRVIPERYSRYGANFDLHLNIGDSMQDGKFATQEITREGEYRKIRLGDENRTITGEHEYTFNYTTIRAINDFTEQDNTERELYWNVTGNEWQVPIGKASIRVELPAPPTKTICFTGSYGSTESDCEIKTQGSTITISATRALLPSEGLTFAVRLPASSMRDVSMYERVTLFIQDNIWVFTPLLVFIAMFYFWWTYGRDPKGRGTVIAEYEEPENLPPGLQVSLIDQQVPSKAITATLLDLARRGYAKLRFEGDPNEGGWFKAKPKTFYEKGKDGDASLLPYEKTLLDGVFASGDSVDLSERHESFWKELQKSRKQIFDELKTKGYFGTDPSVVRFLWSAAAFACVFLGFFFIPLFGELFIVSGILSGIIITLFGWHMPRVTKEGAVMAERVEGFKKFLSVTEKDRLAFTDAPAKKPEEFARFLPAAVAFGVEEKWAGQFANLQLPKPSYVDGPVNAWSAVNYAHAMDSFHSSSASSMYAAPSSAGSGGSGFSGGGSGGGGGGGGGGSW
ncbi:DUF2207 domain-containing protein [Candidatus Uhrbacteria bacterium]|nr:DUF2207 domain-containing protein [Candidatus Uhrbacteria bacterium]